MKKFTFLSFSLMTATLNIPCHASFQDINQEAASPQTKLIREDHFNSCDGIFRVKNPSTQETLPSSNTAQENMNESTAKGFSLLGQIQENAPKFGVKNEQMVTIKDRRISEIQQDNQKIKIIHKNEKSSTTKEEILSLENIQINIYHYYKIKNKVEKEKESESFTLNLMFPEGQQKFIEKIGDKVRYLRFFQTAPNSKSTPTKIVLDVKNCEDFLETVFTALPNIEYLRISKSIPSDMTEIIQQTFVHWYGKRNVTSVTDQIQTACALLTEQN